MLNLFWTFIKINLLTPSGPASIGLIHEEVVGTFITEQQFVQAAAWARVLPGSDALQMAVIVGYQYAGILGAAVALLAAILPASLVASLVFVVLHYFGKSEYMSRFFDGVTPALIALIFYTALDMGRGITLSNTVFTLGVAAFLAYLFKVPAPIVLVGSGLIWLLITPKS